MPGLDLLKEWDVKRHGITGLIVAVIFMLVEVVVPMFKTADPSCQDQVRYLQKQNTELVNDLLNAKRDRKQIDSAYHQAIKPYKGVIK